MQKKNMHIPVFRILSEHKFKPYNNYYFCTDSDSKGVRHRKYMGSGGIVVIAFNSSFF